MTDDTRNKATIKHQNRSRVDEKGMIPGIFNDDENEMKSLTLLPDYWNRCSDLDLCHLCL